VAEYEAEYGPSRPRRWPRRIASFAPRNARTGRRTRDARTRARPCLARRAEQTLLARLLRGCDQIEFTPQHARDEGVLLAGSVTHDIVDAAVVLTAVERNAAVVTSDPDDLIYLVGTMNVCAALHLVCGPEAHHAA
jgi:hypothetical protein